VSRFPLLPEVIFDFATTETTASAALDRRRKRVETPKPVELRARGPGGPRAGAPGGRGRPQLRGDRAPLWSHFGRHGRGLGAALQSRGFARYCAASRGRSAGALRGEGTRPNYRPRQTPSRTGTGRDLGLVVEYFAPWAGQAGLTYAEHSHAVEDLAGIRGRVGRYPEVRCCFVTRSQTAAARKGRTHKESSSKNNFGEPEFERIRALCARGPGIRRLKLQTKNHPARRGDFMFLNDSQRNEDGGNPPVHRLRVTGS